MSVVPDKINPFTELIILDEPPELRSRADCTRREDGVAVARLSWIGSPTCS